MQSGYLVTETNETHPGLVRLYKTETLPRLPVETDSPGGAIPRHAVHFNDVAAARMHAHQQLHRQVVDAANGLYRGTPTEVAAAVESIGLRQRRVYLDPTLAADPTLEPMIAQRRARDARGDRTWRVVGILAVLFLLLKLLLGF